MNLLLTVLVLLMFIGVPAIRYLERRSIQNQTGERIALDLKEKTSLGKILVYVLLAILLLFIIQPGEVTMFTALMKLFVVIGLFVTEGQLRTRMYLTEKHVYMVNRMSHRQLFRLRRFKKGQLYKIDAVPQKKGRYRLFFSGEKNYTETKDILLSNKEDVYVFRHLMKTTLDLYINEPVEIERPDASNEAESKVAMDVLRKYFIALIVVCGALALVKEWAFSETTSLASLVSTLIAFQFIPVTTYLVAYVFVRTSRIQVIHRTKKMPIKHAMFYYMVGSTALPFVVLMNHGITNGERFLVVHLIGFAIIGMLCITSWVIGKSTKFMVDKNVLGHLENFLVMVRSKQRKTP